MCFFLIALSGCHISGLIKHNGQLVQRDIVYAMQWDVSSFNSLPHTPGIVSSVYWYPFCIVQQSAQNHPTQSVHTIRIYIDGIRYWIKQGRPRIILDHRDQADVDY